MITMVRTIEHLRLARHRFGASFARVGLAACLAFIVIYSQAIAATGDRIALVIGNSVYQNVPTLKNPKNDAVDIADEFRDMGFAVQFVENADHDRFRDELKLFARKAREADVAVVYYAGHGIEVNGENYLVPTDAALRHERDVALETVSLDMILTLVDSAKSLRLVILDACRNNPFLAKIERETSTRSLTRGLADVEPTGSTLVAFAAREGAVALDGTERNSPFASALLKYFRQDGLEIGLLFRRVRDEVIRKTGGEQEPYVNGSLSGDLFYFRPKNAVVTTPAPATDDPRALQFAHFERIRQSRDSAELTAFLQTYPQSPFAPLVKARLASLATPAPAAPTTPVAPLTAGAEFSLPIMVTAGEKDRIRVWDGRTRGLLGEIPGEKKRISTVKIAARSGQLLIAGEDGTLDAYALPGLQKRRTGLLGFQASVLAEGRDGMIFVGGAKGTLAALDPRDFSVIWRRRAHLDIVSPILVQDDGRSIVSASADGWIVFTDAVSGQEQSRVQSADGKRITDIAFASKSTLIAVHEDGTIAYVNVAAGRVVQAFKGHDGWISSVDLTPDGAAFVTAGVDGRLAFWTIGATRPHKILPAHSDVAAGAKFVRSGAGVELASVGFDGSLRLWSETGHQLVADLKHDSAIMHFDFTAAPRR